MKVTWEGSDITAGRIIEDLSLGVTDRFSIIAYSTDFGKLAVATLHDGNVWAVGNSTQVAATLNAGKFIAIHPDIALTGYISANGDYDV